MIAFTCSKKSLIGTSCEFDCIIFENCIFAFEFCQVINMYHETLQVKIFLPQCQISFDILRIFKRWDKNMENDLIASRKKTIILISISFEDVSSKAKIGLENFRF